MAESAYFFGFWMYVYLSIRNIDKPVIGQGALAGALLGLQVLIKPHAMLLLPCSAILCGIVVWKKLDEKSNFVKLPLACLALLLAFAAVRIAMTYVLTGKLELSFTGPVYAGFVADSSRIGDTLARLPGYISQLRGHASFVLLTYFTPLMILAFFAMRRFMPGENQRPLDHDSAHYCFSRSRSSRSLLR